MKFSGVYPLYVRKVERKGRTHAEVDQIICWLTGYDAAGNTATVTDAQGKPLTGDTPVKATVTRLDAAPGEKDREQTVYLTPAPVAAPPGSATRGDAPARQFRRRPDQGSRRGDQLRVTRP